MSRSQFPIACTTTRSRSARRVRSSSRRSGRSGSPDAAPRRCRAGRADRERRPRGEHEAPATSTREHDERRREQRPEQAASRVRVGDEPDEDAGEDACAPTRTPARRATRSSASRSRTTKSGCVVASIGHSPELEQPRREPGEHERRSSPRSSCPSAAGEQPEQQDGREHQHGRQPRAQRTDRTRELEDAGEQVWVDRALVVVERVEEEGEDGRRPRLEGPSRACTR